MPFLSLAHVTLFTALSYSLFHGFTLQFAVALRHVPMQCTTLDSSLMKLSSSWSFSPKVSFSVLVYSLPLLTCSLVVTSWTVTSVLFHLDMEGNKVTLGRTDNCFF